MTVAFLQQVANEATNVIAKIEPHQLDNPTLCTEWSVRDIINHLTGGATMFAVSAEQGSVPDDVLAQIVGDNLGDDYRGAWTAASTREMDAFAQDGLLERMVKLPFGEMPATVALNVAIFDVGTHTNDLARATGQTITNTDLLEALFELGQQMVGPEQRAAGLFQAEQPVPADAPIADRLLAFAGRKI